MFNVTRRATAPESLRNNDWRGADVASALSEDFFDKCYLCESKDPLSLNIEHFKSRKKYINQQYNWENLFFSCARCNNFKGADIEILDCTNPELDVCRLIKHTPPHTPFVPINIEAMSGSETVLRTATLISRIYNDNNAGNRKVSGVYLKRRVFARYFELMKHINTYYDNLSSISEKSKALEHIRDSMKKRHEYSAFLRWAILESPPLMEIAGDAID